MAKKSFRSVWLYMSSKSSKIPSWFPAAALVGVVMLYRVLMHSGMAATSQIALNGAAKMEVRDSGKGFSFGFRIS